MFVQYFLSFYDYWVLGVGEIARGKTEVWVKDRRCKRFSFIVWCSKKNNDKIKFNTRHKKISFRRDLINYVVAIYWRLLDGDGLCRWISCLTTFSLSKFFFIFSSVLWSGAIQSSILKLTCLRFSVDFFAAV